MWRFLKAQTAAFQPQGCALSKQTAKDPRPGLNGPNGKKFRRLLLIMSWVLKHNPDCEYFIENLMFDDMPADWDEVCSVLGVPLQVNSMDYSYTKAKQSLLA